MDPQQFDEVSNTIQSLHASMKNAIEIVFATSPLLALSTHGWGLRTIHSTNLLRVGDIYLFFKGLINIEKIFEALGNNRPEILIRLEDHVIQAIIAISEGKSLDDALDNLHSQFLPLEKDLANDKDALTWFKLSTTASSISLTATSTTSEFPCTPLSTMPNIIKDKLRG